MKDTGAGPVTQTTEIEPEYDDASIRFLEAVWGKGSLSPGGYDEIDRIVADLEFGGRHVLDIGCGLGGNAIYLAKTYSLAHITGFDVEQQVIDAAEKLVDEAQLADRVSFLRGNPGPLPFDDASFDMVFSKDAIIHVPDKEAMFVEIFRVLRPGGVFAASDWLISHDDPPSQDMRDYIAAEDIGFHMASPARYKAAMGAAGFVDLKTTNRNSWYREKARGELGRITGPLYDQLCAAVGVRIVEKNIKTWSLMQKVLNSGEHCPTHIFGIKPPL